MVNVYKARRKWGEIFLSGFTVSIFRSGIGEFQLSHVLATIWSLYTQLSQYEHSAVTVVLISISLITNNIQGLLGQSHIF